MYKLVKEKLPKGRKMEDYIREIFETCPTEEAMDRIFRLTYPYALNELKRYGNLTNLTDGVTYASLAFMATYRNYDPERREGSFMAYYKLAIKSSVINNKFGKYKERPEWRELVMKAEGSMESLDEMAFNDEDEKRTKGDILIDETVNIEEEVMLEDLKNDIRRVIQEMYVRIGRHRQSSEDIFNYYMESCMIGEPASYAEIGRKFDKSLTNVRKICVAYKEDFLKLWEERELV